MMGQISLRRTYLVARRDYLGYVKTWGFWISFFLPFVFGILGFLATSLDFDITPTRYEAILDDTGQHKMALLAKEAAKQAEAEGKIIEGLGGVVLSDPDAQALMDRYEREGLDGARAFLDSKVPGSGDRLELPENKTVFIDPPAATIEALQPFLRGEQTIEHQGERITLNGVLHIFEDDGIKANYWSENINSRAVNTMAVDYFRDRAADLYLSTGGLTKDGLDAVQKGSVEITSFDPSKVATDGADSQEVTRIDRIPYFIAAVLTLILWLTVFSGSYMLLTSMLEEKLNKLLEMMLASTRFSEIMFGKLIGVAALTITAMLPYIIIGVVSAIALVLFADPAVSAAVREALSFKMMVFFFIFLVLGYVFYGAFFIALGALAESMQDAQTLTTPVLIVLMLCVAVVPLGLESPDSPVLVFASWFPLSAPFAAIVRLPTDPPLWELCMSAMFVFISAVGVVWLAGRIFRFGVLSGSGVKAVQLWFKQKILRRPS